MRNTMYHLIHEFLENIEGSTPNEGPVPMLLLIAFMSFGLYAVLIS